MANQVGCGGGGGYVSRGMSGRKYIFLYITYGAIQRVLGNKVGGN